MPYIEDARKFAVNFMLETPKDAGELNYVLTINILEYLHDKKLSYQLINDVVGALEGAKLEFYRRIAVPYEEEKKNLNGDVYTENVPVPRD